MYALVAHEEIELVFERHYLKKPTTFPQVKVFIYQA
jgi:hypothetical protein